MAGILPLIMVQFGVDYYACFTDKNLNNIHKFMK